MWLKLKLLSMQFSESKSKVSFHINVCLKYKTVFKIVFYYHVEIDHLAILTDSEYLVNSITLWIFSWLKNGWKKEDGSQVEHKIQYVQLLSAMENIDIKWVPFFFVFIVVIIYNILSNFLIGIYTIK